VKALIFAKLNWEAKLAESVKGWWKRKARPSSTCNSLYCFSFASPKRLFRAFSDKIEKEIKNFSFPDLEYVFSLYLFQKNR
jgi:hypothetical protein